MIIIICLNGWFWDQLVAQGWVDEKISDHEFVNALEFMILNNIIQAPDTDTPFQDNGNFYLVYDPNPNSVYNPPTRDLIIDSRYFDEQVNYLNETFVLPYDIKILLTECDESNAWYEPDLKQIRFCYDLVEDTWVDFLNYYKIELSNGEMTEEDVAFMLFNVIDFVFYHELGHALIDVYELPFLGLEENVADQFATKFILSTENPKDYEGIYGQDIIYNVATHYMIESELYEQSYYWDVHNLDIQRFYNISCYAYGSNPHYNQDLIKDGYLPEERAIYCEYDFWKMSDSWDKLLSKYYK